MKVVLETDRLLLRHFTESDANALLRMESEPDVLRYVGRKPLADGSWRSQPEFIEHVTISGPEYNQRYAHPFA